MKSPWSKETRDQREFRSTYDKARKRLAKIDPVHTRAWAESAIWSIQEALDADRREPDPAALDTVRTGAITLLAAADTLLDKTS